MKYFLFFRPKFLATIKKFSTAMLPIQHKKFIHSQITETYERENTFAAYHDKFPIVLHRNYCRREFFINGNRFDQR